MKHKKANSATPPTKSASYPSNKYEARTEPSKTSPSTNELNGAEGPEPTRYGDWEKNGRVSDF